jgi:hypothetical protein
MVEIIKVYKESFPNLRLIGKCYMDSDRGADGGYGSIWGEWFEKRYFNKLEELGSLPENDNAYVGCMRCSDKFEYWIGMFFPENTIVPEGFQYVDIPKGDIGTCWIYGREDNGELYGMESHNLCMDKIGEAGWRLQENPWFFERYQCPRFTTPDDKGKVILDYGVYLKSESLK